MPGKRSFLNHAPDSHCSWFPVFSGSLGCLAQEGRLRAKHNELPLCLEPLVYGTVKEGRDVTSETQSLLQSGLCILRTSFSRTFSGDVDGIVVNVAVFQNISRYS